MKNIQEKVKYGLNDKGEFLIRNYNYAKPFANFFPGIAGKYGIPMWVFYVNRGQCICSFGTKDKDRAIMEFFPANKSWQLVANQGFRTFLKIKNASGPLYYEPFHDGYSNLKYKITNSMRIGPAYLALEEENATLGLKVKVEYFNIPNDTYAGLSRVVSVQNTSKKPKQIQLIDGMPQIVPFGINNFFLKELGRTIEAWIKVDNLENKAPFFRLAVDPTDRPEVVHIEEGNFYLGFHFNGAKAQMIKPIVDPQAVFGQVTDFSYPALFLAAAKFSYPEKQLLQSKTPCALLSLDLNLKAGGEKTFYAVTGQARNPETLNACIKNIVKPGYIEEKRRQNDAIIAELEKDIFTKSASREFDLYSAQTYLDNIMRGGYPLVFKSGCVFYLYSRKHGDLERDYNKFQLQPTYLSQGNANYRDNNQNRRSDPWFNPEIGDENIVFFMNLIQADGFNPLVVKPESFLLKENIDLNRLLDGQLNPGGIEKLQPFLKKPFSPGELFFFIEKHGIKLKNSYDEFLDLILGASQRIQEAEHGEGFWTDHWAYNLDLIDSYLSLFPEKTSELFFQKKVFSFFDNAEVVRPRSEKYMLYNGLPRQLLSLMLDSNKKEMLRKRQVNPHCLRSQKGEGPVYYTSLAAKLLCLCANKLASLDAFGTGIEMEAGKPNWFDSLNGLPALFGSSICETFELKRLIMLLKSTLEGSGVNQVEVAEEVADFINGLSGILSEEDFNYWDKSGNLKENYRFNTRMGFSGAETALDKQSLLRFLDTALQKVEKGLSKALDEKGVYTAYFINEVSEYERVKERGIRVKKFKQVRVPYFLEGQMHALRLSDGQEQAGALHKATKASPLFDKKLKMYKVTAPLEPMPEEIGRCRIFAPGWLENESIWLHMEYKYILELLKRGLTEEFYAEFKNVLICFQDPARYGRSILENSSFLVSSAFPDKELHGNGFVARLSGSTAEFLQIWLLMNCGLKPFFLDNAGELNLTFRPALAGWLFDKNGEYKFNFLSKIPVTYHNPKRKDTFGKNAAQVKRILVHHQGSSTEFSGNTVSAVLAQSIRRRQVEKIDIWLE